MYIYIYIYIHIHTYTHTAADIHAHTRSGREHPEPFSDRISGFRVFGLGFRFRASGIVVPSLRADKEGKGRGHQPRAAKPGQKHPEY